MFRRPGIKRANTGAEWKTDTRWHSWEPPRNIVAGEASYQPALRAAAKTPGGAVFLPADVTFQREPENVHDPNAFMAFVASNHVGYLRRQYALELANRCDKARCSTFTVCGLLRGGYKDAPHVGCHVWFARRLSNGPALAVAADDWLVSWPAWEFEQRPH